MRLAAEFAAWMQELRRFPEDLALGLCPLLRQLAVALGAGFRSEVGQGEPDGVSGITQRERFERLLPSQWLLASEVPDEFLRRAAMHELMFLESAKRQPRAASRSIVVFDAGPSQLGTPRLVQLAMLLVMERRARQAGAQLRWVTAQSPDVIHSACEQSDILALLAARSPREPTEEDVRRIAERIDLSGDGREVLWVGGTQLCALARTDGRHCCRLIDPLRQANDQVVLEVHVGHRRREFVLQLPAPEIRTRLIRRPFDAGPEVCRVIAPGTDPFCFSPDGRRVLVFPGNRIEAHLPQYARNFVPQTFEPPPQGRIVGGGWHSKSLLVLYADNGSLTVHWAGRKLPVCVRQREFVVPQGSPVSCRLVMLGRRAPHLMICDAKGTLFMGRFAPFANAVELRPILDRVLELRWRHGSLSYARLRTAGELEFGSVDASGNVGSTKMFFCAMPPELVAGSQGGSGVFAVQTRERSAAEPREATLLSGGRWNIVGRAATTQIVELDDSELAIACLPAEVAFQPQSAPTARPGETWCILTYSWSEKRLFVVSEGARCPLYAIPEPASRILWDERLSLLLYRDQLGNLRSVHYAARNAAFKIEPRGGEKP